MKCIVSENSQPESEETDDERERFKEKLKSINFGRVPGGAR
jgi:hypothetical protein